MRSKVGDGRIVRSFATRSYGLPTLPLLFTNDLEECNGDESTGRRNERVTGLVPLGVVFATQNMEEVAFVESQLLTILVLGFVIIEGFDDLLRRDDGDGAFGAQAEVRRLTLVFVAFERPANSLENERAWSVTEWQAG